MKKVLTVMLIVVSAITTMRGAVPPEGSFVWGMPVPMRIEYRASDTLKLTSPTISQFTVTYTLQDTTLSSYVSLNGNVVTVLNCYAGTTELTKNRIYIDAHISGMAQYQDTTIETYILTKKIVPEINWTCTLGDMTCGSSVYLSATHTNTDKPNMEVTFGAVDNESNPSKRIDIDQTTDMMKAIAVGNGIYVTAKIDSSDNFKATSAAYIRNDSIVRFNVAKGYRNISWDENDFKSFNNLMGNVQLKVEYEDSEDSVTIVSDNPAVAYVTPGNVLHILKNGTIKLTATVGSNTNYYKTVSDTTINIAAVATTVAWDEDYIRLAEAGKFVTSTTKGLDLKLWVNSNYGDSARYSFTVPQSEESMAKVLNDTELCCYDEGEIDLSVYATADGGKSSVITRKVQINRGVLKFVNAGYWSDSTCWSRSDLVSLIDNYDIEITNKCAISRGSKAECQKMTIFANGSVTIEPGALLTVKDTIVNYGGTLALYLQADSDSAAEIIINGGNPEATVEMYINSEMRPGVDTVWSNRGMMVKGGTLKSNSGHLMVKRWNESKAQMEDCSMIARGYKAKLNEWEGYMIADTMPGVYAVEGTLLSGDQEIALSYTEGSKAGRNFIANSYVAPVAIDGIEFENMNSELFVYADGQYQTLPKHTAGTLGRAYWGAGKALFAGAQSKESKLIVKYTDAVSAGTSAETYNMLRIAVRNAAGKQDTVTLMAADNCSDGYDDGYDGTKWEGDANMPMLYANNQWGKACVNVEKSIIGQQIGFKSGAPNETYTISFDTKGLSGYDQLYLFDTKTQEFTDIIGKAEYTFTGNYQDEPTRFTIMRDKVEPKKDKYGRCIMVIGNKILVVGFENTNSKLRVVNMQGKVVCEYNVQDGPWFDLPQLLNGVYVINADECSTKIYR